jgi:uncharacterized protein (TIGR02453 family)
MNFRKLFDFLRNLNHQNHNHKTWMDENRSTYEAVRDEYIAFLEEVSKELAAMHPDYHPTTGKQAINRINNNKVFHPNKPTYKDHFGAGLDKSKNYADFYIHLGINECFVAGGFYHPPSETLGKIRAAVDYNGGEFKKILNDKEFKAYYGDMMDEDALKTSPKGYSQEHPHINLLRMKSFAVMHPLTQKEVMGSGFRKELIKAYFLLLPFRDYLNQAASFQEE